MDKPFSSKKADLPFSKLIVFLIVIMAIVFLIAKSGETMGLAKWGIGSSKRLTFQEEYKFECRTYHKNCDLVISVCKEVNDECGYGDIKKYEDYLNVKDCLKAAECIDDEQREWDEFLKEHDIITENTQNNNIDETPSDDDNAPGKNSEDNNDDDNTPKQTPDDPPPIEPSHNTDTVEQFAKENNLDPDKLKAIIKVESSGKPFVGDHPTVRFECVRYNKRVSSQDQVPCDTSTYKYGSAKDTGLTAFKNALEKDRSEAIRQTSFGLGQVMGFNYERAGYSSEEDFYIAMFREEEQVKAFLNFVISDDAILSELKKDDTNWAVIAENYNGEDYATNNYDTKLENTYQELIA